MRKFGNPQGYSIVSPVKELLSFDDVVIIPKLSDIPSRSLCYPGVSLYTHSDKRYQLDVPVISSPMDTVTEGAMVKAMAEAGGAGVVHRYNTIEAQVSHLDTVRGSGMVYGGAIGATGDYIERCQALIEAGASILIMDVANGFNSQIVSAAEALWKAVSQLQYVHFVVGNVASGDGYRYLAETKLFDAIRCGIGGGSICTTAVQTGCGYPTLASVLEASESQEHLWESPQIIADGGLRTSGDVAKALAAGASYALLGSMLAGTSETPGAVMQGSDGKAYKAYRGMASEEAQKSRGQLQPRVEGVSATVPYRGSVVSVVESIRNGLQSAFSMVGAYTLEMFQNKATFGRLSHASYVQSTAHILKGV